RLLPRRDRAARARRRRGGLRLPARGPALRDRDDGAAGAVARRARAAPRERAHRSMTTRPAFGNGGSGPPVSSAAIRPQSGWWPTATTAVPLSPAAAWTAFAVAPGARRSSGCAVVPSARAISPAV